MRLGRVCTALLLLTSCSDPTAPIELSGDFDVQTFNGSPLPAPLPFVTQPTATLGGTVSVMPNDTLRMRILQGPIGTTTPSVIERFYRYERSGDSIIVRNAGLSGGRIRRSDVEILFMVAFPPSITTEVMPYLLTLRPSP